MANRAMARMIGRLAVWIALVAYPLWGQGVSPEGAAAARSKLNDLRSGAATSAAAPMVFSELEVNSYLAFDLARKFPAGLESVESRLFDGRLAGLARVDFDLLRQSTSRPLPRLAQFFLTGTHDIRVEGTLSGRAGKGTFQMESVSIDGLPMPQFLLELLLTHFVRGRFTDLNLDAPFTLPYSIQTLRVQPGQVSVAGPQASLP